MEFIKRIDNGIAIVFSTIIVLTSAFMTGLVFFLVLSRYFFGSSILGMLEMATICALWLYMVGAIVSSRNSEHLTVDFLETSITNPKTYAIYETVRTLIVFGLSLFVLKLAYDMLGWSLKRPQTTPTLGLPLLWQQASMLLAMVYFTLYAIRDIIRALLRFKTAEQKEG